MAICPFAAWKPVTAHGGAMGPIIGVVIHVTAGEGDPFNEFANPANQVSSHFGIGNGQGGMADGALEQYVDTANESWAQVAGNKNYLSVETEGEPTEPLTPAQVATFGRVLAWAHATHGIPMVVVDAPGQPGLITHGDGGSAWGGHTGCPGDLRKAQREAIIAAAGAPTPTPGGSMDFPKAIASELTADGLGSWVAGTDGGVFTSGTAVFYGSLGAAPPAAAIVDIVRSSDGKGYYLVGADGGVFSFGDAKFYGSYPGLPPAGRQGNRSFGGGALSVHAGGVGYTLVALDGDRYIFGS